MKEGRKEVSKQASSLGSPNVSTFEHDLTRVLMRASGRTDCSIIPQLSEHNHAWKQSLVSQEPDHALTASEF